MGEPKTNVASRMARRAPNKNSRYQKLPQLLRH